MMSATYDSSVLTQETYNADLHNKSQQMLKFGY